MWIQRTAILSMVALIASCSSAGNPEIVVSAASSLTESFLALEEAFEASHPDIDVIMNFAGSSTLREQILEGAPVDIFAPADQAHMDRVDQAGLLAGPQVAFARNSLVIGVPKGNPAAVSGVDDFARPELILGLCLIGVPCGDLAMEVLEKANVAPEVDTREPDVRSLVSKIAFGEVDAGMVYQTDVQAHRDRMDGIEIPPELNVTSRYPIAVVSRAGGSPRAADFVDFVLSDEGLEILARFGFTAP